MLTATADLSECRRGRWSRRKMLAATAGMTLLGCRDRAKSTTETEAGLRRQVPLRVVWSGSPSDGESLQRTWQSVSEQPLDVVCIDPLRGIDKEQALPATWLDAVKQSDVVIYPLLRMGELASTELLMPLPGQLVFEAEQTTDVSSTKRVPAALKVATTFAGERRGLPLGGYLPAFLQSENALEANAMPVRTWAEYDGFVDRHDGKVAEPTAAGWAGAMFLWRLVSSMETTWLFDRETLAPLVDQSAYVDVLDGMQATVQKQKRTDLTPGQIWNQVASGELVGGIGFPATQTGDDSAGIVHASNLPTVVVRSLGLSPPEGIDSEPSAALQRKLFDPFTLVISMSASCRQSASAMQFLRWLSGGKGSEAAARSIDAIHRIDSASGGDGSEGDYSGWLRRELRSPNVVSPLQLIRSMDYYRVLDSSVRSCVRGEQTAKAASQRIAQEWSQLHDQVGLETQKRCWFRSQGLG